jgi:Uma2 family endonuclease
VAVSEALFELVALADDTAHWELICGRLRPKPRMTAFHGQIARNLIRQLILQLPDEGLTVEREGPNLRVPGGNYRIPDVCVVPRHLVAQRQQDRPTALEIYEAPMPLVVEVWSPSTGDYDVDQKLKEYKLRGDLEIWRLHPSERTLIREVRQADGTYVETLHAGGVVHPAFLPGVAIDLDALFA